MTAPVGIGLGRASTAPVAARGHHRAAFPQAIVHEPHAPPLGPSNGVRGQSRVLRTSSEEANTLPTCHREWPVPAPCGAVLSTQEVLFLVVVDTPTSQDQFP